MNEIHGIHFILHRSFTDSCKLPNNTIKNLFNINYNKVTIAVIYTNFMLRKTMFINECY